MSSVCPTVRLVIKFFPEITIKGKAARQELAQQLAKNIKKLLLPLNSSISITAHWDNIQITLENQPVLYRQVINRLRNTPGIDNITRVQCFEFSDLEDIYQKTAEIWGQQLAGHSFAVRCKRVGKHSFNTLQVERYIGTGLCRDFSHGGVDLRSPDITVNIEIRGDTLYVIEAYIKGNGGFPIGSQGSVLSLISGGFDSAVSSYLTMARGLKTHFLFFDLGGDKHEMQTQEVAYYLWHKFAASHKVKFITVPFTDIVNHLQTHISHSQMGVILKRMFLRAATQIAKQHKLEVVVTGEAIAQVSSQTLPNLALIDQVTDALVLRPLITMNKSDIIGLARRIGTEPFSSSMPEYCGVISIKPTTHARQSRIDREEANFDFSLLDDAVAHARVISIAKLGDMKHPEIRFNIYGEVPKGAIIIDIRHPDEIELKPLQHTAPILTIPFYLLQKRTGTLHPTQHYLLYCAQGIMSKRHANHLRSQGMNNIDVFQQNSPECPLN